MNCSAVRHPETSLVKLHPETSFVKLLDWELFLTKTNPCHQHVNLGSSFLLTVLVHGEVLVGHHGVRLSLEGAGGGEGILNKGKSLPPSCPLGQLLPADCTCAWRGTPLWWFHSLALALASLCSMCVHGPVQGGGGILSAIPGWCWLTGSLWGFTGSLFTSSLSSLALASLCSSVMDRMASCQVTVPGVMCSCKGVGD